MAAGENHFAPELNEKEVIERKKATKKRTEEKEAKKERKQSMAWKHFKVKLENFILTI